MIGIRQNDIIGIRQNDMKGLRQRLNFVGAALAQEGLRLQQRALKEMLGAFRLRQCISFVGAPLAHWRTKPPSIAPLLFIMALPAGFVGALEVSKRVCVSAVVEFHHGEF
jgi:hypothetical protein